MSHKNSLSVNIVRDTDRQYNYIVTPNAKRTIERIITDFNKGNHCSVVIGSYGTGKSSLLLAFERTLLGKDSYFDVSALGLGNAQTKFVRIVGEYQSIVDSFAHQFNVTGSNTESSQIFDAIFQEYQTLGETGLLVIYIDEFGKFLEYAAKNNSEKELYFIQQLAEFANAHDRRILLLSTLHQNFEAYSFGLNERQRNEWVKVKGRLSEIAFNEPIEQLLLLASEYIKGSPANKRTSNEIELLNGLVKKNFIFTANEDFIKTVGTTLYPIDFISGYCLTLALQRYGQNERSLFSFLESKEFLSIKDKGEYFSLVWLHDYLWGNFYSLLSLKDAEWLRIKGSIEKAETLISSDLLEESIQTIKVIGLLQMFASKGAKIDLDFLNQYLSLACGLKQPKEALEELAKFKIARFSNYNHSFSLFEGTDLDISGALEKAESGLDEIFDIASYINLHVGELPQVTAKKVSYEKGTPRNFAFVVSETPKQLNPQNEIDGYINLIINSIYSEKELLAFAGKQEEAVVYGLYKNSSKIKNHIIEIEKAEKVKEENDDDKVVVKEMNAIVEHHKRLVRHHFVDALYTEEVVWVFKGQVQNRIANKREFNKWLSVVVNEIYPDTPVFKNELVNRHKISNSIHSARKDFFEALVNNWNEGDLSFDKDRFPPEKAIYVSLLKTNQIHRGTKNGFELVRPSSNSSFIKVWNACEAFLESTKTEKKPITELYEILSQKPFKLKLGLTEIWVPLFLFIKRDDFALFGDNGYIPDLNETMLLLLTRNTKEYSIKAFNLEGVKLDLFNKYRDFLKQSPQAKPNNESFIESIKPFLVFYRQLPEYAKHTKGLSPEAKAVRDAIAKSTEPEKTFFEDFPNALNVSIKELNDSKESLQEYSANLKLAINEIRNCYDELLVRFENLIKTEIGAKDSDFALYQKQLKSRFKRLKMHLLLPYQKQFYSGVINPIDERSSWLSSLGQSILNKPLASIKDEDEKVLQSKFKSLLNELDNLTEISEVSTTDKEKVFRFEITTEKYAKKSIVKVPFTKFDSLEKTERGIRELLNEDKQLNIAILAKLIQEQLENE